MRNFFKRYVPSNADAPQHRHLHYLGDWIKEPNLWHLNRRSVAGGIAAGLFCAFLPLPGQIILASMIAFFLKGNIFLAGAATWLSNPITYLPIFYFNYQVGNVLMGGPLGASEASFSFSEVWKNITSIGIPLVLGSTIMGLLASVMAYYSILLVWRVYVIQLWEKRRDRRKPFINRLPLVNKPHSKNEKKD